MAQLLLRSAARSAQGKGLCAALASCLQHANTSTPAVACSWLSSQSPLALPPLPRPWHQYSSIPSSPTQTTPVDSIWTAPNLLSVARAFSGPPIMWLIMTEQWPVAVAAVAVSGATDWADGALARKHAAHGPGKAAGIQGSYLDPLADKVLVGCVVSALAAKGLAPMWVAVLVVGRDVGLVGGMFLHRWRMLGWRTRGVTAEEFFQTSLPIPGPGSAPSSSPTPPPPGTAPFSPPPPGTSPKPESPPRAESTGDGSPGGLATEGMPLMKPLLISKLNTVLQLLLVGSFMTQAWVQVPGVVVLHNLELMTASTTVASIAAYGYLYASGQLLPESQASRPNDR